MTIMFIYYTNTSFLKNDLQAREILDSGDKNSPHWTTNSGIHQFKNNVCPPGFSFIECQPMLLSCKASFIHILLLFLNLCETKVHVFLSREKENGNSDDHTFDAKGRCISSTVGYQGTCFGCFIVPQPVNRPCSSTLVGIVLLFLLSHTKRLSPGKVTSKCGLCFAIQLIESKIFSKPGT